MKATFSPTPAERCPGPNISTTPITAMGRWQFLPLSVVQLKGKLCRKPHCRNGVVDMFAPGLRDILSLLEKSYGRYTIHETSL